MREAADEFAMRDMHGATFAAAPAAPDHACPTLAVEHSGGLRLVVAGGWCPCTGPGRV